ncbi:MAG: bifunctional phosphoglucose/phosphomannose isomerase [Anaerolineales bacterium]
MNLNDPLLFKKFDASDMIGHIKGLPDQISAAWELGQKPELPGWTNIQQIVVSGMGGSAIGADLVQAYALPELPIPFTTHRDYGLPANARGEGTLVICSSHSGNTEETFSAFGAAKASGCRILVISTGGRLADEAKKNGIPLWTFEHKGQPRAAVGFSFALLLAALARLKLISDPAGELSVATATMKDQQKSFLPEVPDTANPAKRMGGQLMGRWVTIYGAGIMAPVARRWKTQINENAKAQASFEFLPEADHNALEGISQPEDQFGATMAIFLRASQNHPRNERRAELTRMSVMLSGQNTDEINAAGETRLAQMWTALHYGDYTSYYLAIAYGADPSPVPTISEFKQKMG